MESFIDVKKTSQRPQWDKIETTNIYTWIWKSRDQNYIKLYFSYKAKQILLRIAVPYFWIHLKVYIINDTGIISSQRI